jgi:hypothetical protein
MPASNCISTLTRHEPVTTIYTPEFPRVPFMPSQLLQSSFSQGAGEHSNDPIETQDALAQALADEEPILATTSTIELPAVLPNARP